MSWVTSLWSPFLKGEATPQACAFEIAVPFPVLNCFFGFSLHYVYS